jgi:hypothetical protein
LLNQLVNIIEVPATSSILVNSGSKGETSVSAGAGLLGGDVALNGCENITYGFMQCFSGDFPTSGKMILPKGGMIFPKGGTILLKGGMILFKGSMMSYQGWNDSSLWRNDSSQRQSDSAQRRSDPSKRRHNSSFGRHGASRSRNRFFKDVNVIMAGKKMQATKF